MSLTLLLLEDDHATSEALRALFEESPSAITVLAAETLKQAESHDRNEVDAVLLDLNVPDSHGLATLNAILHHFSPVPVIVLTGATDEGLAERALELGADDYLEKALAPPAAIQRVVRYAMRQSRQRIEAAERDAQNAALARFGQLALGDTPTNALLGSLCTVIAHVLRVPGVTFMERSHEDVLLVRHTLGCTHDRWSPIRVDEAGPIAEAVRTNRTVSLPDAREVTEEATAARFRDLGAVSVAAVPVRTSFARPEGALAVWRHELHPFTPQEIAFVEAMANVVAAAMQRNAMQNALRANEHQVEGILDAVPDQVLRFDDKLCVRYVNQAARRELPSVRIGMHVSELAFLPSHRARWRAMIERALTSGVAERFDMEGPALHRFDASVVPLLDEDRRSVVVVLRDITERVRMQTRYETLFASNVVGVFFCDSEGVITQANRAFLDLVERDATAVSSRKLTLHDVMAPAAQAIHAARLREIRNHGVMPPLPADLVHRAGHTVPVLIASAVVQQMPEEIVNFVVDETATRRAEAESRNQTLLLDNARDAIILRDGDGVVRFWNEGAHHLYGWTRAEAVGKRMTELVRTTGETTEEAIDASLLSCGEWQGELNQEKRDGTPIVVDSRCSRIPSSYGEAPMTLIITTDITERKSLERQLLHAQRIETLGILASGIAHDLNNILMPILMGAEYLRRLGMPPEAERTLERITTSSRRGADIIRQLLAFAGGRVGDKEATHPQILIGEVERMLVETTPPSIAIVTDVEEGVWPIAADATQVLQVLLNLGLNARDAMAEGGTLTIHAENVDIDEQYANMNPGSAPGAYVMISVSDTGSGIPPEMIGRIFEPFFTTKAPNSGTGLGLATTRAIVRSHGGFINAYSEPGRTVFKVYLPASHEIGIAHVDAETRPVVRGNDELILVIEDEMAIRDVTAATLKSFGYRVVTAADGSEGIALYAQNPDIALVITDMLMPVIDGPTTIRALRKLNPHVRIIGMSGYTRQRANEVGADLLLQKPFRAADLLQAITSTLSGSGRGERQTAGS